MTSVINQAEIQNLIVQKHRSINPNQSRQSLLQFIATPAYKVRNIKIMKDELMLFGQLIATIQQGEFDKLISEINDQKAATIVQYLHRFMQFIGQEQKSGSSGNALKFYDKILTKFGRGIIMRACFRQTSLVSLVNNYEIGR